VIVRKLVVQALGESHEMSWEVIVRDGTPVRLPFDSEIAALDRAHELGRALGAAIVYEDQPFKGESWLLATTVSLKVHARHAAMTTDDESGKQMGVEGETKPCTVTGCSGTITFREDSHPPGWHLGTEKVAGIELMSEARPGWCCDEDPEHWTDGRAPAAPVT
jgi:hypothetical protein